MITTTTPRARVGGGQTSLGAFRAQQRVMRGVKTVSCDADPAPRPCAARYRAADVRTNDEARAQAAEHGWDYDPAARRDLCPTHRPTPA